MQAAHNKTWKKAKDMFYNSMHTYIYIYIDMYTLLCMCVYAKLL